MKKLSTHLLVSMTMLSLLGSCGKATSDGSGIQEAEAPGSTDGSTIDGNYLARFETLNPHVNGTIPGSLTLFRKGDKLMTYVRLFAGGPQVWHQQGIYTGKRCPTMKDDTNGDGFIDIDEGMNVFGKMIIPLDANMNSQNAGKNFYPLADLSGYYHYERIASFKRMFEDLYEVDRDPADHIVKLAEGEPFTFEGRVVVVQGVAETTVLPESIAIQGRRRPFQTLPITCGIIRKVTSEPGTIDSGTIPGPVAPVEDGQDRPAPPEEDTGSAEGGTVSGTTGTNDTNDGRTGDGEGNETSGEDNGETTGGSGGRSTTGGTTGGTTGRVTGGGFIGGFIGGRNSGGRSTSGRTTGGRGETTGSTGGGTTGGTSGGFIGGFIGGSSGGEGGSSGGSTGGTTTGGSEGR